MSARSTITPCIFGTTNGFEIQTLTRLPLNLEDLAFGITRSDVELADGDECVKTFRLRSKSEIYTWIGLYRKAYEIGFSREGGYYGSGVWLAGISVDASLVLNVLQDLANQMNALALVEGRFQRPLTDIIGDMQIPRNLLPLKESSEPYTRNGLLPNAVPSAYICQSGSISEIVDWAQNNALAERFRSVIIAPAACFPRSASSRMEYYADFAEVVRELESDRSVKMARLEADKRALQEHVASLESQLEAERVQAQKFARAAERWKRESDKFERKFEQAVDVRDGDNLPWLDYLVYAASGSALVLILYLAYAFFSLLTNDDPSQATVDKSESPTEQAAPSELSPAVDGTVSSDKNT